MKVHSLSVASGAWRPTYVMRAELKCSRRARSAGVAITTSPTQLGSTTAILCGSGIPAL